MCSAQTRLNVLSPFFSSRFTRVCALIWPFFLHSHRKRERDSQQDEDWPYVKKPLNAFMLYRQEQRANVAAELNIRDSATINKVLGQKVSVFSLHVWDVFWTSWQFVFSSRARIFNLNLLSHVQRTNSSYFQHFMPQIALWEFEPALINEVCFYACVSVRDATNNYFYHWLILWKIKLECCLKRHYQITSFVWPTVQNSKTQTTETINRLPI